MYENRVELEWTKSFFFFFIIRWQLDIVLSPVRNASTLVDCT